MGEFPAIKDLTLVAAYNTIVYVRVSEGEETHRWTVLGALQYSLTLFRRLNEEVRYENQAHQDRLEGYDSGTRWYRGDR